MDGEQDGAQAQQQVEGQPEGGQPSQQGGQGQQPQQEPQAQLQVGAGDAKPEDYEAQLRTKDAKIAELSAKVADAAKSQKAADDLGRQIAELKRQMEEERTEFALRSAGARSVTAAKALLAEHDGDVEALVKAESWLFEGAGTKGGVEGTTGLEPAGASGGSDTQYMRRWERIAGLVDEGKEG